MPEKKDGILPRLRMFRNYGNLQIASNRLLHFPAVPYKRKRLDAPILIHHFGNIKTETRQMKYERYIEQDKEGLKQGYTYRYLLENDVILENVAKIRCNVFKNGIQWFIE